MRPAEYKAQGRIPPIHIQLADRLEKRLGKDAPGTYRPGDRIQFVVTEAAEPGQKTSENGEDPDYAWAHNVPLSRVHYIENGVHKTMRRVLEPVLMPDVIVRNENQRKHIVERAFNAFLRVRPPSAASAPVAKSARRTGLFALATRTLQRCRLCGVVGETDVCEAHDDAEVAAHRAAQRDTREHLDTERLTLWRTCRACVAGFRLEDEPDADLPPLTSDIESLAVATPCKNNTCTVYWERRRNDRVLGYN